MGGETLVIIPARGGSKGIPRKNLVPVAGRPLLVHTIEAALVSKRVTRIVVSTEDEEIARIAEAEGAEVVRRPEEIADDRASSESALLHVLDELGNDGYEPDLVVFLQATSPLRARNDIDEAIRHLVAENADSLFSACRTHGFVWRRSENRVSAVSFDHTDRKRRQDLGEDFLENGSIYVFRPAILRQTGNRLGGKIAVYEMDPLFSFQVDEPRDVELIESIWAIAASRDKPMSDLAETRLLVLDFDGVMTDDRVVVDQDGTESVVCQRGDGYGIELLRRSGVEVVVLSKETNQVVGARCNKLGIECHQGFDDKLPQLLSLAEKRGLRAENVVYVGNDLNDLECVRWAGVGVAVADANPGLLAEVKWVTKRRGGHGAVREVCDAIIEQFEGEIE